ncbi:hypothetical protein K2F54_18445 [Cryobacterium sp. 1639]|uniref:hypothetical protein n=1 Tax=Cryobacterium inferilacus TaxID=2866629 RepID=UPI001C736FB9|nr:hypothetical protein [Cryobacterium sp. 1639]MBX0301947.1 hypothetical protein [Cryobacterium sp. 1639]
MARAVKTLLQHKLLVSLFLTFLHLFLILPINQAIFFDIPGDDSKKAITSLILRAGFAVLLFGLIYSVLKFAEGIVAGGLLYRRWLLAGGVYLLVNVVVLAFIWPGYWVWDEYFLLNGVRDGTLPVWQGLFTGIFYVFCLYLIPTGGGVVIVQVLIASAVVGYVIAQTAGLLKRSWLAGLLLIPLVSAPVLLYNFYPLRLTVYSYLELLVLFRLILIAKGNARTTNRYVEFMALSAAIMLLAVWRSEGVYYLILLPILFIAFKMFRIKGEKLLALGATVVSLAIVLGGYGLNKSATDPRYEVTATLNPLSVMLQQPLKGDKLEDSLAAIDRVIDLEVVKEMPSAYEIPSFFAGALRPDFEANLGGYNRAFLQVVMDNPGAFVSARVDTFIAANALTDRFPQIFGARAYLTEPTPRVLEVRDKFDKNNYFSNALSPEVRDSTIQALLMVDDDGKPSIGAKVTWTVIPVGILLLVALGVGIARKKWIAAGLVTLVGARLVLIFLTAPALYFMYYLPVFLSGWMLLAYYSVVVLDRNFGWVHKTTQPVRRLVVSRRTQSADAHHAHVSVSTAGAESGPR